MLHVRTSQLIIAGDGCGIQEDFSPGAWQWKTSDVTLMEIVGHDQPERQDVHQK